jgi:hypothetical protein
LTKCHSITNEVKIDLDVLGALVLNRVCGHVDDAKFVTKHDGGPRERSMKFLQELAEPSGLSDGVGDGVVLGLGAGARHGVLAFGRPRHQVIAEEDALAGDGATSVGATRQSASV